MNTPTSIAILGSGRVATSLAKGLAKAGHALLIGVRNPSEVKTWQDPEATLVIHEEAIRGAGIVFNATPGDSSLDRLGALAEQLDGKILVDLSNATGRDEQGRPSGLMYPSDNLTERLQAALPRTQVVKTLNTMLAPVMSNPVMLGGAPTVFVSGNDQNAKAAVRTLLGDLGWNES